MINIETYQNSSRLKEFCLFQFTFSIIGKVEGLDLGKINYNIILNNQQLAVDNKYIKPCVVRQSPLALPFISEYQNPIVANAYNILRTEINSDASCLFEYAEFTDQNILLPNVGVATAYLSVFLKSYLDILTNFPHLKIKLKFAFSSTKPTYFYPNYDIWGSEYCPLENALIDPGTSYEYIMDNTTTPYDVIQTFSKQFSYPLGYIPTHITSNHSNVQDVWKEIFKR